MSIISIIVPVFNVEKYLHRCLDSILAQTFTDWECILVDDGSPDNSGKICDEYAAKDSRFKVIHKENGGQGSARNMAIDIATGQYFSFIDSDDWIFEDFLRILFHACVDNSILMASCEFQKTDGTSVLPIDDYNITTLTAEKLFIKQYGSPTVTNKLYNKVLFSDIRFPEDKIYEDAFISYKLLFKCNNVSFCDAKMYYYYQSENSTTRSKWTPKHLAEVEIHTEIYNYLKQHKMKEPLKIEIVAFTICLNRQLNMIKKQQIDDKENEMFLRKKLKKYCIMRLWYMRDISIKTKPDMFEFAFPFYSAFYWNVKGVKNKIKRYLTK